MRRAAVNPLAPWGDQPPSPRGAAVSPLRTVLAVSPAVHRGHQGWQLLPRFRNQLAWISDRWPSVGCSPSSGSSAWSLFAPGLVPIVVIVANRAEPDSRGMRPFTVYLMGMAFFTLLLAYAGLTMVITALLSFIGPHYAPIGNSVAREVVIGGLLILIAGGTMYRHLRQGLALARGDGRVDGPNSRVLHSYIGVVSFVFTVAAMLSLGVAIYMLFELIGPGVFAAGAGQRHAEHPVGPCLHFGCLRRHRDVHGTAGASGHAAAADADGPCCIVGLGAAASAACGVVTGPHRAAPGRNGQLAWQAVSRAPVAQGIEHRFPKPCAEVRILPGAQRELDPVVESR